jgi:hypothetical protein
MHKTKHRSLDPRSPYVVNFHHGHTMKCSDLIDASSSHRLKYRWNSQPDLSSLCENSPTSLRDPKALATWRQEKADACLGKLNGILEQAEEESISVDSHGRAPDVMRRSEKRSAVHRSYSDPIFSLRQRLELDGIPSTPELCALQAILPKQVLDLCATSQIPNGFRSHVYGQITEWS